MKIRRKIFLGILMVIPALLIHFAGEYLHSNADNTYTVYSEGGDIRDYITGTGTYFNVKRGFYRDSNGDVAYCLQTRRPGSTVSGTTGYTENQATVLINENLTNGIKEIAYNAYPARFGTYITGGNMNAPVYKTGLMIHGMLYECTAEEARSVTTYSIHRQMMAYAALHEPASGGNEDSLNSISKGPKANCDIVGIHDAMIDYTKHDEISISTGWAKRNENGEYTDSESASPTRNLLNPEYMDVYVCIRTENCSVEEVSLLTGDTYISDAYIENIEYKSEFLAYAHILFPASEKNYGKTVGVKCSSLACRYGDAKIYGNENYQDIVVVPYKSEISAELKETLDASVGRIKKVDSGTKNPLPDVIFGIYRDKSCTESVAELKTGLDGIAETPVLSCGTYYIKELAGYQTYLTDNTVYELAVNPFTVAELVIDNTSIEVKIELEKQNSQTRSGISLGDASLGNAQYTIYARENILYPDRRGGTYKNAGEVCGVITTDSFGKGVSSSLYPGKYYIKETAAPEGYLLDETEIDVDLSLATEEKPVERIYIKKVTVFETEKKQAFELIKFTGKPGDMQLPLEGAGFSAWLISELNINEKGEYDFQSAKPYPIGSNGNTEMFTDKNGYACSAELPYGTYIVKETTVPEGFLPVKDFKVVISEDSRTPQKWRLLNDSQLEARLKIIKKDSKTGRSILIPGFEFRIYDVNKQCYVEQKISYPVEKVCDTFLTNEEGYLMLPEKLSAGSYEIEEVGIPGECNYIQSTEKICITIDENTPVEFDTYDNTAIVTAEFYNTPVLGELVIKKKLKDYDKVQTLYENTATNSDVVTDSESDNQRVKFTLFAAENIFYNDGRRDENGEKQLQYRENDRVEDIVLDEGLSGSVKNLPLGRYYLEETETYDGYVLLKDKLYFSIEYQDIYTAEVVNELEVENSPTTTQFVKQDESTGAAVSGAVIKVTDENGRVLETFTTGTTPHIIKGLVPGIKYYFTETEAPYGYLLAETKEFCPADIEEVQEICMKEKSPEGRLGIEKTGDVILAIDEAEELLKENPDMEIIYEEAALGGVIFDLYAAEDIKSFDDEKTLLITKGTKMGRVETDENGKAAFEGLPIGFYSLVEIKSDSEHVVYPYSIPVTIEYVDSVTSVVYGEIGVKNDRIRTSVDIEKVDGESGEKLMGAVLGLFAYEDILDGNGRVVIAKDTRIMTRTSDKNGDAFFEFSLMAGKYYIKEISAPEDYELSEEQIIFQVVEGSSQDFSFQFENFRAGIVLGDSGEVTETTETPTQVVTGDKFSFGIVWVLVLVLGSMTGLIILKKK